jgi:hypothetical protein
MAWPSRSLRDPSNFPVDSCRRLGPPLRNTRQLCLTNQCAGPSADCSPYASCSSCISITPLDAPGRIPCGDLSVFPLPKGTRVRTASSTPPIAAFDPHHSSHRSVRIVDCPIAGCSQTPRPAFFMTVRREIPEPRRETGMRSPENPSRARTARCGREGRARRPNTCRRHKPASATAVVMHHAVQAPDRLLVPASVLILAGAFRLVPTSYLCPADHVRDLNRRESRI